jgi:hypothetical protein
MPFAQGSRSALAIQAETTFGVAPATPTLVYLPIKTHSLNLTKQRLQGADITPDRMPRVDRHGNRQAGGSIEVDLRKGDYDGLLESAFMGTFSVNVLKVGSTLKSFHIEDRAEDIAQFRLFKGMSVSSASFSIAPNQMVQTTFEMVGKDMAQSGTSFDSTATSPSTNQPFDSYNGLLYEGGVGTSDLLGVVSALNFSINNAFAPTYVVGASTTPQLEFGMATVEGTMTVYYENATLINKFLNETVSKLQIEVDDPTGASAYTFFMPRVKYNGANAPLANPQSRFVELPFVALFDTVEGTNLKLTRTA